MVKIKVHAVKKNSPLTHPFIHISTLQRIQQNTKISVEVNSIDEGKVTICAILTTDSRAGKWNVELVSEGFVASENTLEFTDGRASVGGMRSYCRAIKATNK